MTHTAQHSPLRYPPASALRRSRRGSTELRHQTRHLSAVCGECLLERVVRGLLLLLQRAQPLNMLPLVSLHLRDFLLHLGEQREGGAAVRAWRVADLTSVCVRAALQRV